MQSTVASTDTTLELARDLAALVAHIHRHCTTDLLEAFGAVDLTMTQIKLLHRLEETDEELSLKAGAELVRVSLPAASRLVDDLVRRGLVERREDPEDRRMKRVRLTGEGREVIRRLGAARLSGMREFIGALSPAERAQLNETLTLLLQRPEIAACRSEGNAP